MNLRPCKIGDATMYYWGRIPLQMGISSNNTTVAKLSYQSNKRIALEPKGLPERDIMFLCLWLNKQLGCQPYINITSWWAQAIHQATLQVALPHPCLGEVANQSSSKSNINLKIRFLTDNARIRAPRELESAMNISVAPNEDTATGVNQVNMICRICLRHKPWDSVLNFWVWEPMRTKWN